MDEWSGDSGLKEDWDGTISKAEFEQGQRGNWQLRIYVDADDGDNQEYIYSVGGKDKGWQSFDGGETITGASEKARFHIKSAMQKFIDAVMKIEPAAEELRKRSSEQYGGRGPFHAAIWVGMRFHWDVVEEIGGKQLPDGTWEDAKIQVVRPTAYLGAGSPQTPPPSTGPAKSANAQADSGTNGAVSADLVQADLDTLTKLALTHDDHGKFVDAVMEETFANGEKGIRNKPIMKLVTKRDWYEAARA